MLDDKQDVIDSQGQPVSDEQTAEVEATSRELVEQPEPQQMANLFGVDDPTKVITKARKVAKALKKVLDESDLITEFPSRDKKTGKTKINRHVEIAGWQTLGSMLGITAIITATNKIDKGYEAFAEARLVGTGAVIGRAEAQCTRSEPLWTDRAEYALRSMAQTRAMSRSLKGPLGFVISLAGYSSTPAEEVDNSTYQSRTERAQDRMGTPPKAATVVPPPAQAPMITKKQTDEINKLLQSKDISEDARMVIVTEVDLYSASKADAVLKKLRSIKDKEQSNA